MNNLIKQYLPYLFIRYFTFPGTIFVYILLTTFLVGVVFTTSGQEHTNNITFVQEGNFFSVINQSDSLTLERKPFSIRYYGKQYTDKKNYAAQIAVFKDPEDTLMLKNGQSTSAIPYFEPGTGMAPGNNGWYDTIYITNSGHHYLYYENKGAARADLISKKKDILELEWKISGAYDSEKSVSFSELDSSTLYFVVFIDNNLNEVIDPDELKVIRVNFK